MSMAAVFGADLLIVLVIFVCVFLVPIWAVADAATRPAAAFARAGSNGTTWNVVIVVAWLFGLAFFLGGFYLLVTRSKVRRQMEGTV